MSEPGPAAPGAPTLRIGLAAALAGFACMAAELTAVRVLAPHFGDSAYVWTNVIGVILAALAAGAWLGGRLAGRSDGHALASVLLAGAGLLVAVVPFAAGPLANWLLPAELPLDAAMPAMVRGSLVATAVLFAPPLLLLGAVSPLLVTDLARGGVAVGRAAGTVSAAATVGSLAGTFAATHWLVPQFGCRAALAIGGASLLAAAAIVATTRSRAKLGAAVLLAAASGFLHGGPLRPPQPGRELLAERETAIQYLQVQREARADGPARTLLLINEGLDSFHSLSIAGSAFTGGAYYDWHALAPLLAGDGVRPKPLRVLSIGDAAGTLRRVYAGVHPGAVVDGVDIDAACFELGEQWFGPAPSEGGRHVADGRTFLAHGAATWQVIHVDAYAHQVYIPAHLASREFFAAAYARLAPGGVIACNVGALRPDDKVLRAIGTTLASVFGRALACQVPASRNYLLVARRDQPLDPGRLAGFTFGGEALNGPDVDHWRELVAAAAKPSAWVDVGSGGDELVDDRPVLDQLLHAGYVAHEATAELVHCMGALDPVAAEQQAYQRRLDRDWLGVLAGVAASQRPTAYLRQLAGDARWSLRELGSAALEYEEALRLSEATDERTRLTAKLEALAADTEPSRLAERTARRNGWLQWAVIGLALAACAVARRVS